MDSGFVAPGQTLEDDYDLLRPLLPEEVLVSHSERPYPTQVDGERGSISIRVCAKFLDCPAEGARAIVERKPFRHLLRRPMSFYRERMQGG